MGCLKCLPSLYLNGPSKLVWTAGGNQALTKWVYQKRWENFIGLVPWKNPGNSVSCHKDTLRNLCNIFIFFFPFYSSPFCPPTSSSFSGSYLIITKQLVPLSSDHASSDIKTEIIIFPQTSERKIALRLTAALTGALAWDGANHCCSRNELVLFVRPPTLPYPHSQDQPHPSRLFVYLVYFGSGKGASIVQSTLLYGESKESVMW